ncbi:MAG TPA: hypothetical protein VG248_07870 [Caulobacteraceae bacterium]|jgi:hypothetical protein|nr:hypothetical protein [Caulobacteraceae bacterium]
MRRVRVALAATLVAGLLGGFALAQTLPGSGRIPQFENAQVKVWRTRVATGDPLPLHRHDHPRVVVALSDGELDLRNAAGAVERLPMQNGHAYWLPAMAAGAMHQDVNPGREPLDLMVVELK